jgi:hypothetical protein
VIRKTEIVAMASPPMPPCGVAKRDNERWCMGGTWTPGGAGGTRRRGMRGRSAAGRDDVSTRGWNTHGAITHGTGVISA